MRNASLIYVGFLCMERVCIYSREQPCVCVCVWICVHVCVHTETASTWLKRQRQRGGGGGAGPQTCLPFASMFVNVYLICTLHNEQTETGWAHVWIYVCHQNQDTLWKLLSLHIRSERQPSENLFSTLGLESLGGGLRRMENISVKMWTFAPAHIH